MSKHRNYQLTIDELEIAWLKIDIENQSVNTLNKSFADDMSEVLEQLDLHCHELKGLVIYSGKTNCFIAGADIEMIDSCDSAEQADLLASGAQAIFERLEKMPFTTIAAIDGVCLGGGLEFALACDYRIGTTEPKTMLGLPEVKLGLLPGAGGTQRLPRLIGLIPSIDLILTGKQITAKKALKLGLIDLIVDKDSLINTCQHVIVSEIRFTKRISFIAKLNTHLSNNVWVRKFIIRQARRKAQNKAHYNYPAIDKILDCILFGLENGFEKGIRNEAEAFGELAMTPVSESLRRLFFLTTAAKKRYRLEQDAQDIKQVSVIGGGLMGAGISFVTLAVAKLPIHIKDLEHAAISKSIKYSAERLERKIRSGKMTRFEQKKTLLNLTGSTDYVRVGKSNIIVEAVFEDMDLKQQIVRDCEEVCSSETVLASNTSSIPISKIAEMAIHPERIIGIHYFSPVEKMPLVEVIPHENTNPATIATALALAYQQGKTPIKVKDSAGFYVNRILVPYIQGAFRCLKAGEPIDVIDNALEDFGFPVGPFALLDEVGFDVAGKIPPILQAALGDRFASDGIFEAVLEDGRKGRKSGLGFYRYGQTKRVDNKIYKLLSIDISPQMKAQEIVLSCLLPMLNEATRCLKDGVIETAEDGDLGAVLGIGFPPFLGGPFYFMNTRGIASIVEKMQLHSKKFGPFYEPDTELVSMKMKGESFY
ncbi:fatty acid oxidation complex subunit alpha FadJ [Vibrio sp.]|nr:fatty acid oxidation complex subunit alpha FadJ [Vibrio sp.]